MARAKLVDEPCGRYQDEIRWFLASAAEAAYPNVARPCSTWSRRQRADERYGKDASASSFARCACRRRGGHPSRRRRPRARCGREVAGALRRPHAPPVKLRAELASSPGSNDGDGRALARRSIRPGLHFLPTVGRNEQSGHRTRPRGSAKRSTRLARRDRLTAGRHNAPPR